MKTDFFVYTVAIGAGIAVHAPRVKDPGIRYVVITDQDDLDSNGWIVKRVRSSGSPRLQSRDIKIHPWVLFPEAQASLYLDSTFELRCSAVTMADEWLGTWDMAALQHPYHETVEEEARVIAQTGKAPRDVVEAQAAHYREQGFNRQRAITSTGICLRRHTRTVRHFADRWWAELLKWCDRDQMSVDYCAWCAGLRIGYMEDHYQKNRYAKYHKRNQ